MHPFLAGELGAGRRTFGEDRAWRRGFNLAAAAGNGKTPP